jgi:sec-independent protein translocase protein TatA
VGILGNAFSGWHLLLILAVILLLFGAARLPGLAKGIGQSVRILRTESTRTAPADEESDAAAASRLSGSTSA